MNCAVCSHKEFIPDFINTLKSSEWVLNEKKYGYKTCIHCGFMNCDPLPSQEELLDFYNNLYPYDWFRKNSFYKKIQARHRLFKIRKYLTASSKLLDFGCGHGFFVEAVAKTGVASYGFDVGVDKIITKNGFNIQNKNSFEEFVETGFDVITAWHVIEHMRDPNKVLSDLRERLTRKGKIIIAVPNLASLGFKLFAQKWGWVQQPYVHINFFNDHSLSLLLEKHGFKIISVQTIDTWDQSLYDLLITRFFYKNKSRNTVREFKPSVKGELIFRANQLVRLGFAPLSYLVSFLRKSKKEGSELLIVAEKIADQ